MSRFWQYLVLAWFFIASTALAQTPVTGAIAVNTHWTMAESPYLLSGDVVVQNNAVLTIDPGVTVYMAAEASLTVQGGGIQALGTLTNPINILSDKSRLAQDAAPGDWKQWVFNPGTTNTRLGHVRFEHGKGLSIKGSAPVLNYLQINNQQGAAITIDLAASPTGNQALTVNLSSSDPGKVSVPASVTIPANTSYAYFTVTGVDLTGGSPVTIDAAAQGYAAPALTLTSLDTVRNPLSARDDFYLQLSVPGVGVSYPNAQTPVSGMTFDLGVAEGNPAGIIDGFYLAASGGAAVSQAMIAAGQTWSGWLYAGTPTAAGSYRVQAGAAGVASATSGLVTVNPADLALAFPKPTVVVGKGLNTYQYEVWVSRTLNGATYNGNQALTVNLSCSSTAICKVPANVTIPANSNYAYFTVEGVGLGNTTITASADGYNSPAQDLAVSTVVPRALFSGPSNTTIGGKSNFTVYLNIPGTSYPNNQTTIADKTVSITSSAPGVATAPATLTIPAGSSSSANAQLTGVASGTTTLTASGVDLESGNSNVITIGQ